MSRIMGTAPFLLGSPEKWAIGAILGQLGKADGTGFTLVLTISSAIMSCPTEPDEFGLNHANRPVGNFSHQVKSSHDILRILRIIIQPITVLSGLHMFVRGISLSRHLFSSEANPQKSGGCKLRRDCAFKRKTLNRLVPAA